MQYKTLGNSGLIVSRLSLGTMTFGTGSTSTGFKLTLDQKAANEMVSKSIDIGINLFDTADMYGSGQSEEILGKALKAKRKDMLIATKFGFRAGKAIIDSGMSRQHIISAVEASLKRPGTDYIDLYQVHYDDGITPLEELAGAMDNLVQRGLVRYIGFSNFYPWRASIIMEIQKQRNLTEFVSSQMYYSLLCRDLEHEFIPFSEYRNLGILVWSPLAGGLLSGKYSAGISEEDIGRLNSSDFLPRDDELSNKVIGLAQKIARNHDASPAQVSLAWLLAKPYTTSVIIGATKMSHFEDNIKSIEMELTDDELKELDDLSSPKLPYPNWFYKQISDPALEDLSL